MSFKWLIFTGFSVWGKNEISKDYFVSAVNRGDYIVNVKDGTYYDKDTNSWKLIEGDQ